MDDPSTTRTDADLRTSAHHKALRINLDSKKYGTFAEIGAGQEVVAWFFRVGGAAGTVAESISAYDMKVSTALYGACRRYVSEERLLEMLDCEYAVLIERLEAERADDRCFFVFADTAKAMGYHTSGECHAWLGVRYQPRPHAAPQEIILHARLLGEDREAQQRALGRLGVNLLYGAFYEPPDADLAAFTGSLVDGIAPAQVEVDMLKVSGAAFAGWDNRACALQLVESGLAPAAMFMAGGEVVQPGDVLYGKAVLLARGNFRPMTRVHLDMFRAAREAFHGAQSETVDIAEMTMRNLLEDKTHEKKDFLARADLLQAAGKAVLVSRFTRFDELGTFLRRYTAGAVGVILGFELLREVFDEGWYEDLDGGILESFGRLFRRNVKLYVYPERDPATGVLKRAEEAGLKGDSELFYRHLLRRGLLVPVEEAPGVPLDLPSREVEKHVIARTEGWRDNLDAETARAIEERDLFRE